MRQLPLAILLALISNISIAQVGIGTITPLETLHVAGTARIETTDQPTVFTDKLFGLDPDGTLREVTVGANLTLSNNVLSARSGFDYSFGSITLPDLDEHHNVDLLMGPGEVNEGKAIIRINRDVDPTAKVELTGFVNGYDGQHVWIYAQQGQVVLVPNDINSAVGNRIEDNDKPSMKEWAMIEIVYDGTRNIWTIMQNHGD